MLQRKALPGHHRRSLARTGYALACVLTLATVLHGQALKSTPEGEGWPEYGGTLAGQRYSTAKQVDRTNVAQLKVAWTFHTHAFDKPSKMSNWKASAEATPVLWKNILYFDSPFDTIFAVDAATGSQLWTFDPQVNRESEIYIVAARGVAMWHAKHPRQGICNSDTVVVATLDRRLISRDAKTGAACPNFGKDGVINLTKGVDLAEPTMYGFTSPPTIVGDTIVLGSSVADNHDTFVASGAVRGFDALTGKQKWSWEPLLWAANKKPRPSGSGNAWSILSADPENDLLFVPTGSPSLDFYGGTRLGDNRDADSIIALRASTGQRVWAFQLVHHDIWDYDVPSEPVLFTFRNSIPAVAVTTKTSMVYVFNRLTGEPLYPITERPVPPSTLPGEQAWPTQPFSSLPTLTPLGYTAKDLHLHDPGDQKFCTNLLQKVDNRGIFTPPSKNGTLLFPGSLGGANWGSSAFDPTSGVLFTRVTNFPYIVRQVASADIHVSREIWARRLGLKSLPAWAGGDPSPLTSGYLTPDSGGKSTSFEGLQSGSPYHLSRQAFATAAGTPCAPTPFGSIVAINLNTGKKVWSVAHGEMMKGEPGSMGVGGVIATAGGLIFAASTNDAQFRAYDSDTGRELWKTPLPTSSNATPMTYTVKGRQYIVISAGGHGFIGTKSDQVVAFALPMSTTGKVAHR